MYALETIIQMNQDAHAKWEKTQRNELQKLLEQIMTKDVRTVTEVLKENPALTEKLKEVLHG